MADRLSQLTAASVTVGLVVLGLSGCMSAGDYRRKADRVAYGIIKHTQKRALGHAEPFTIAQPAQALRKRLLLDQGLPFTGPSSLGTFYLSPIPHWPDDDYLKSGLPGYEPLVTVKDHQPLKLTLIQALQVAARASREYQTRKEDVYRSALALDLERDQFRFTFADVLTGNAIADLQGQDTDGVVATNTGSLVKQLKNGIALTGRIGLDLVKLLTQEHSSSLGLFGDASISIPLLRGAGRYIVAEPLTQAQRNTLYAIYRFQRFKRTFAVQVASSYLAVLQQRNRVENSRRNYLRLTAAARRYQRMAQAGRFSQIQVDQIIQQKLSGQNRLLTARQQYASRLDGFKLTLGVPVDADLVLDPTELTKLAKRLRRVLGPIPLPKPAAESERMEDVPLLQVPQNAPPQQPPPADIKPQVPGLNTSPSAASGQAQTQDRQTPGDEQGGQPAGPSNSLQTPGPLELPPNKAIKLALAHRLDLRTNVGRVYDAQRKIVVAADAFQPELTLLGQVNAGGQRSGLASAARPDDTSLSAAEARYNALVTLDLPLERTLERNQYRGRLIDLEQSVRNVQELEDTIKQAVRSDLRGLRVSRQTVRVQVQAVKLARKQVASVALFLRAGQGGVDAQDLTQAQNSLLSAENRLTSALVSYRVNVLRIQRDMGLLDVNSKGLYREYSPSNDDKTQKNRPGERPS